MAIEPNGPDPLPQVPTPIALLQQPEPMMQVLQPALLRQPIIDQSFDLIFMKDHTVREDRSLDPMQSEYQTSVKLTLNKVNSPMSPEQAAPSAVPIPISLEVVTADASAPMISQTQAYEPEKFIPPLETEGEISEGLTAPPGFPVPEYINQAHTICSGTIHMTDKNVQAAP